MPNGSEIEVEFSNLKALTDHASSSTDTPVGKWNYLIDISAWPVSCREEGKDEVKDYFLVEFVGQSSILGNDGALKGYALEVHFGDPNFHAGNTGPTSPIMSMHLSASDIAAGLRPIGSAIWPLPPGIWLVDSKPDSTVSTTSYTDSVSKTIGGSLGFFGDTIQGSISGSVTVGNSTTRNVSDLTIEKRSGMIDNLSCWWVYQVQPGTQEAEGDTPILAQFLVGRDRSTEDFQFSVTVTALVDGGKIVLAGAAEAIHAVEGQPDAPMFSDGTVTLIQSYSGDQYPELYTDNTAGFAKSFASKVKAPPAPPTA